MILEFCSDFNNYLMSNYSYKRQPAHYNDINNTICAKKKRFDLYLRFKQNQGNWKSDTVVIARIYFPEQRKGNGHNLLKFLMDNSQQYNYSKIGIEEANENAAGFALRYGFKNFKGRDWIVDIEKLKRHFN